MAFEGLTERLQNAISKLKRKGKISESDVKEVMREIRLALLEADVNFKVVKDFVKEVKNRAVGAEVLESLTPAQQIVKIVNEELIKVMGESAVSLNKSKKIPTVIMMVGLQGAGKTTTAGKLAYKLKKEENARPLMIAADVYRPAAVDQLKTVGKSIDVPVFELGTDVDPVEIVRQGMKLAEEQKNDYVIIDTAGRLQIDEKLMNELARIKELTHPERMASIILGMGDMLTLIEKAQQDFDQKKAEELADKMRENTFDFNDFIEQMEQVQNMGPIEDIMKMIPGMANNPALKNVKVDPKDIEHTKAIVYSMTPAEREDPDMLNPSRRRRIAAGSGRPIQEVNRMIKQFKQMRDMMQRMTNGNFGGMENMFGGGISGKLAKMSVNRMIKKNKKKKRVKIKKQKQQKRRKK